MKKQIGIWLNTDKAVLVSLADGNESIHTIESQIESRERFPGEGKNYSRLGSMLVNPSKKITEKRKHQLHHYFDEILHNLEDASSIYLFGPSKTKKLFEKEMKEHHGFDQKVIEVENADKMTTNQLIAKVKDHFKGRAV